MRSASQYNTINESCTWIKNFKIKTVFYLWPLMHTGFKILKNESNIADCQCHWINLGYNFPSTVPDC